MFNCPDHGFQRSIFAIATLARRRQTAPKIRANMFVPVFLATLDSTVTLVSGAGRSNNCYNRHVCGSVIGYSTNVCVDINTCTIVVSFL